MKNGIIDRAYMTSISDL